MKWIDASKEKPKALRPVLVRVLVERYPKGPKKEIPFVTIAEYVLARTVLAENFLMEDELSCDYDEETDTEWTPEGWWESVEFSDYGNFIDETVTHWMPLPSVDVEKED